MGNKYLYPVETELQVLNLLLHGVSHHHLNIKITYKDELNSLNKLIRNNFLAGIGYDIHKTKKNIKSNLIKLGGVKIKSKIKVISHSDGDVILHAITDSILGALSQRDIGTYFPNTKKNLNRNSIDFLNYSLKKMTLRKMLINNIDIMIVSEEPKINPHFEIISTTNKSRFFICSSFNGYIILICF